MKIYPLISYNNISLLIITCLLRVEINYNTGIAANNSFVVDRLTLINPSYSASSSGNTLFKKSLSSDFTLYSPIKRAEKAKPINMAPPINVTVLAEIICATILPPMTAINEQIA